MRIALCTLQAAPAIGRIIAYGECLIGVALLLGATVAPLQLLPLARFLTLGFHLSIIAAQVHPLHPSSGTALTTLRYLT